jgi:type II secretory pathway pseudopilin PulG
MTAKNGGALITVAAVVGIIGGAAAIIWGNEDREAKKEGRLVALESYAERNQEDHMEMKESLREIRAYILNERGRR